MSAARNPASRARANPDAYREKLEAICESLRGRSATNWIENERGDRSPIGVVAPAPFRVACRLHGVSWETLRDAMARDVGVRERVEAARAAGVQVAIEMGVSDTKNGRQWTWLAERIGSDELHLPTKVTGVRAEDGGAPIEVKPPQTRAEALKELRTIRGEIDAELAKEGG